jgi:hypothetical protein
MFRWREEGGPPVWPPTQKGFGSAVLEQVMAEYFDAPTRIDFAMDGLCYQLNGSLEATLQMDAAPFFQGGADKVAPPYRRLSTEGRKHRRF